VERKRVYKNGEERETQWKRNIGPCIALSNVEYFVWQTRAIFCEVCSGCSTYTSYYKEDVTPSLCCSMPPCQRAADISFNTTVSVCVGEVLYITGAQSEKIDIF
jgi:hypothetical protein